MTKEMNRREFLHGSTVAGMAGYSAMALASSSAAHAQSSGGQSYRIGIIGSTGRGGYGHELDEAWRVFPNCEVVGVADDNDNGRKRAQKGRKWPKMPKGAQTGQEGPTWPKNCPKRANGPKMVIWGSLGRRGGLERVPNPAFE